MGSKKSEVKKVLEEKIDTTLLPFNSLAYRLHNKFIAAKGKTSPVSWKLFCIGLKYAKEQEDGIVRSVIPVNDIKVICGIQSNGGMYTMLKRACLQKNSQSLMNWQLTMADDERNCFDTINVINRARYKDGIFTIDYSPNVKHYLINLKNNYTTLNLEETISLKTTFAIQLYLNLKAKRDFFRNIRKTKGAIEWRVHLTELKLIFGLFSIEEGSAVSKFFSKVDSEDVDYISLTEYMRANDLMPYNNNYREFKRRVLVPSVKDINTNTSLTVEFEEVKKSRAVEWIVFSIGGTDKAISEKDEKVVDGKASILDETKGESTSETTDKDKKDGTEKTISLSAGQLSGYAMIYGMLSETLKEKDIMTIAEAASFNYTSVKDVYDIAVSQGNIRNLTGWMVKMLKSGDYSKPLSVDSPKSNMKSSFHNFDERKYDYDEIEKKYVINQ